MVDGKILPGDLKVTRHFVPRDACAFTYDETGNFLSKVKLGL